MSKLNIAYIFFIVAGITSLFYRFPLIMFNVSLSLVVVIIGFKLYELIKFKYSLHKYGYGVTKCKVNSFDYVEIINNKKNKMKFKCKNIDYGTSEICISSESEWKENNPEWAKDNRHKIINNLKLIFRNNSRYVFPT